MTPLTSLFRKLNLTLKIAAEIAAPLTEAKKITMVSTGGGDIGAAKLTGEVFYLKKIEASFLLLWYKPEILCRAFLRVFRRSGSTEHSIGQGPCAKFGFFFL